MKKVLLLVVPFLLAQCLSSPTTETDNSPWTEASGVSVVISDGMIVTTMPTSSCMEVTATPIVIGEYLVFATHLKSAMPDGTNSECAGDTTPTALYAVSTLTGEAFTIASDINSESTSTVTSDQKIILTLLSNSNGQLLWWSDDNASYSQPFGNVSSDSAGLWDASQSWYLFGTVNTPNVFCQGSTSSSSDARSDCGALAAVSSDGTIQAQLNSDSGFRGWVTGAPTSDGDSYYVGTGTGNFGGSEPSPNTMYACSVVKLSKNLEVLASYDDGDDGCVSIGNLESAVVGEIPIYGSALWIQYLGTSTSGESATRIVQLMKTDLSVICAAEVNGISARGSSGTYYKAPVIDALGNAYVTLNNLDNDFKSSLVKIAAADCSVTTLLDTTDTDASSPALADDAYVLVASGGELHVVDRNTGTTTTYSLGSSGQAHGSPVIHSNGVSVVTEDAVVTTLTGTGLSGYGSDPWPRFRRDNSGSAAE